MPKLASERTHKAHESGLALEQTLAAWTPTGLATVGVGLAVAKLLPDVTAHRIVHPLGIISSIGGGIAFLLGCHATEAGILSCSDPKM